MTTTTTAPNTTTTKPYSVNVSVVDTISRIGSGVEASTIGTPIEGTYEDENDIMDTQIQDIYNEHNNKNISTYIGNYISIQRMTNQVEKINSRLERTLNRNINYGADGVITFH